jgi:hypothetical protein
MKTNTEKGNTMSFKVGDRVTPANVDSVPPDTLGRVFVRKVNPKVRDELKEALAAFKDATLRLDLAWERHGNGDAIADYPECLPSFDEFSCYVQAMEVRDDA